MINRAMYMVGSSPAATTDEAMNEMLEPAGPYLSALPDGETGDRRNRIASVMEGMRTHTDLDVRREGDFAGYDRLLHRQLVTPPESLGRVDAASRRLSWGSAPIGALLGGGLGDWIGIRTTLFVAGFGAWACCLFVVLSPLRKMRDFPEPTGRTG
jgi:hypothetical protein